MLKRTVLPVLIAALFTALLLATTAQVNTPNAGDIDPPHLVALSIEPSIIDTKQGPAFIYVTAHITDDMSGAGILRGYTTMRFQSYHAQHVEAKFQPAYTLISGTVTNGVFQTVVEVPQYSETGEWTMEYLALVDGIGNVRFMHRWELANLGISSSFIVTDSYTAPATPTPEFPPTAPFVPTVPAKVTPTPIKYYIPIAANN